MSLRLTKDVSARVWQQVEQQSRWVGEQQLPLRLCWRGVTPELPAQRRWRVLSPSLLFVDYAKPEVASVFHRVSAVAPGLSDDFTHKWPLEGERAAESTTTGYCMDGYWNADLTVLFFFCLFVFLQSYNKVITECVLSVAAGKHNVTESVEW